MNDDDISTTSHLDENRVIKELFTVKSWKSVRQN